MLTRKERIEEARRIYSNNYYGKSNFYYNMYPHECSKTCYGCQSCTYVKATEEILNKHTGLLWVNEVHNLINAGETVILVKCNYASKENGISLYPVNSLFNKDRNNEGCEKWFPSDKFISIMERGENKNVAE